MAHSTGAVEEEDDDMNWEVSPEYLAKLSEKYKGDDFPLFMENCPNDVSSNPHLQALQSLVYDDETPESLATHFKKCGNQYYEDGSQHYKDAIISYSKGLEENCSDEKLNSLLLSNRGHVRLLMGHYIDCVDDCRSAIRRDVGNTKAYYRAAKASFYMRLFRQATNFCKAGLKQFPHNELLISLSKQSLEALEKENAKKRVDEQQRRQKNAQTDSQLTTALQTRGIQVKEPIYDVAANLDVSVSLDDDGVLHWPAMILYDEFMTSDFIMDVAETQTFEEHAKVLLPGDSFPAWDLHKQYSWEKIVAYFEPGLPDGSMVPLRLDKPIGEVLSKVGVVAQRVVLHLMLRDSLTHRHFLETERITEIYYQFA